MVSTRTFGNWTGHNRKVAFVGVRRIFGVWPVKSMRRTCSNADTAAWRRDIAGLLKDNCLQGTLRHISSLERLSKNDGLQRTLRHGGVERLSKNDGLQRTLRHGGVERLSTNNDGLQRTLRHNVERLFTNNDGLQRVLRHLNTRIRLNA